MQYKAGNENEEYIIAPIIGLVIAALYFVIPFRKMCGKRSLAEDALVQDTNSADNDFLLQLTKFNGDYMKNNPVISKKTWEEWLSYLQSKSYIDVGTSETTKDIFNKYNSAPRNSGILDYAENWAPLESARDSYVNPRSSRYNQQIYSQYAHVSQNASSDPYNPNNLQPIQNNPVPPAPQYLSPASAYSNYPPQPNPQISYPPKPNPQISFPPQPNPQINYPVYPPNYQVPPNYPLNNPQNYPPSNPQNYSPSSPQNYSPSSPQNYTPSNPQNYPPSNPQNYPPPGYNQPPYPNYPNNPRYP